MARSATNGTVSADMRPTDYRGAVKRLETIDNKATKQQKIAKEIGEVYSACEGICGVSKVAAKMWRALKKLEGPERLEVFRDLNGLIDAAGWDRQGADLVDQAQNNVVHVGFGNGNGDGSIDDEVDVDGDDGDGEELNPDEQPAQEDDFEASAEELARQEGRGRLGKARERAKRAAAPPLPEKDETPPEERDPPADPDADLANAGEE